MSISTNNYKDIMITVCDTALEYNIKRQRLSYIPHQHCVVSKQGEKTHPPYGMTGSVAKLLNFNETLDNVFGHNITSDSYFEKLKNADKLESL